MINTPMVMCSRSSLSS